MKEIRWLHFTDLHVGCNSYDWMWPSLKEQLLDDLKSQYLINGPWELVIFTGDLTYSGTQFADFEKVLIELWGFFETLGCNPLLLVVPGNHDILRPDKHNAVAKVLENWKDESLIQKLFWNSADNEYRGFTDNLFANFVDWQSNSKIKMPNVIKGILPGDFSTKLTINDIELGIVGINTAAIHFSDSFKENTLVMHQKQFLTLLSDDYSQWFKETDFSVLMTHHDSSWLDDNGRDCYNSLVNPPDRFSVHLCGHLHDSQSIHASESGALPRLVLKGAALFGLKKWGNNYDRTLGYTLGKFILDGDTKIVKFWPRKLIKRNAGNFKIDCDQGYEVKNESVTIHLTKQLNVEVLPLESAMTSENGVILSIQDKTMGVNNIPRFSVYDEKHHQSVRLHDQGALISALKSFNGAWITADWGLGKDSFIRSVLSKFIQNLCITEKPIYIMLPCDDIDSFDDLLYLIEEYCNTTIQELCHILGDKHLFLIFDNIPSELTNKINLITLEALFKTILDYSKSFYIIGITRLKLVSNYLKVINLEPLSIPDLRTYVELHPNNNLDIIDGDYVDRLHSMSQGYPLYIDLLLKMLAVSSFDDLIELDFDFALDDFESEERIPRALKVAVRSLSSSTDEYTIRSYKLLKVLSVLANGETYSKIRRFNSTKPFHPLNVTTLVDLSLIDVMPIYTQTKDISLSSSTFNDHNIDKLLRVPRQVRDYVKSQLSDDESLEIIKTSAELLFGAEWRQGNIKMVGSNFFKSHGAKPIELGNEHIVVKSLMWHSIKNSDLSLLKQAALIGKRYCNLLFDENRYKDSKLAAEELCHFLSDADNISDFQYLKLVLARSLRMLSKHEEALSILRTLVDNTDNVFTKSDLASIYLNIALINEKQPVKDDVIAAAKKAQSYSKKGSSIYNQATSIILNNSDHIDNKQSMLQQLEITTRRKKQYSVANNICIDFSRKSTGTNKLKLLDTVINSEGDDNYNKIIAIVYKVKHLAKPENIAYITNKDCLNISIAYSYLYSQRMDNLFNQCHDAIWNLLILNKEYTKVLKLFMHSSFLWRIRGDFDKESQYIAQLQTLPMTTISNSSNEYRYFSSRSSNAIDLII